MATPNPIPIPQVSVNKWREESSEKLTATLSEKQPNKFAHYELVQNGNSLWRTNLYILTLSTDCFNQIIFQLDEYQYQVSSNHSLASNYIVSTRFPTNKLIKVKDKPYPFINFLSPHSARALLLSSSTLQVMHTTDLPLEPKNRDSDIRRQRHKVSSVK